KMLLEQLHRDLDRAGIDHGVRAAGWSDVGKEHLMQLCSIQTEASKVYRRGEWLLHPAERVIIDEAHLFNNPTANHILDDHHADGAAYVGFTATPIDLANQYDLLIVAGTNSELRQCGALVVAD